MSCGSKSGCGCGKAEAAAEVPLEALSSPEAEAEGIDEPLPTVFEAQLDEGLLAQLFADWRECAEILEVLPRYPQNAYTSVEAPDVMTLEKGLKLWVEGALSGLQVRYEYEGKLWADTLVPLLNSTRLVRMEIPERQA
jgi:hypothetical protein